MAEQYNLEEKSIWALIIKLNKENSLREITTLMSLNGLFSRKGNEQIMLVY